MTRDKILQEYKDCFCNFFIHLLNDSQNQHGQIASIHTSPHISTILNLLFEKLFLLLNRFTINDLTFDLFKRALFLYNESHQKIIGHDIEKCTMTDTNWIGKPLLLQIAFYAINERVSVEAMRVYALFHVNVCTKDIVVCCQELISVCLKALVESDEGHLFNRSLSLLQVFKN